ncbi:hypothetical protein [Trichocoleus sp. FACHB-262]|uniref:hypothetical protein n=1 Tax=Trichocoleus sp. FACHB-262 TaxID=2692869 RepID=UPI0019B05564|nr:hypothetical protein [Trichocoleus sp. FACHB-262]MBD2120308.1 hypothetical protein [Trichocoleus sp. FACHB-262]
MKWKAIAGVSVGVLLLLMGCNRTTSMPTIDADKQPRTQNWVTDEMNGNWLIDTASIKATTFTLRDNWRYYWTQKLIGKGVQYDLKLKNPEKRNKGLKLVITNIIHSCENSDPIAARTLTLVERNGKHKLDQTYIDPRDRHASLPSRQPKGTNSRYLELIRARCRQAGVEPNF